MNNFVTDSVFILKESVIPLFILLAVSAFYKKKFNPDISGINSVTLQLLSPILIFKKVTDSGYGLRAISTPFIFMVLFTLIMSLIALVICNVSKMESSKKSAFFSNATLMNFGNIGIPLVIFALGDNVSSEVIMIWLVFNISLSTYGLWLADNKEGVSKVLKNIIRIPVFPAFLIAITINELSISTPTILNKPMNFISEATFPMMTIIFGMKLADIVYKKGILKFSLLCLLVRLIISPLVALFLVFILEMPHNLATVSAIMVSTPMASTPIMYAIELKKDAELLTTLVFISTAVSILTLPIAITVIRYALV